MVEPQPTKTVSFSQETKTSPIATDVGSEVKRMPESTTNSTVLFSLGSSTSLPHITDNMAPSPEQDYKTEVIETEAERTLPWKRNTTNDIVPCLTNLVMTDDEKPLMSEAPSWVSNPSYHNLKESGSPYVSPQNTLTAPPEKTHTPSIFEIFQQDNKPPPVAMKNDMASVSQDIPLTRPWDLGGGEEPIASPCINQNGDKTSNLLHSAHSVFPPPHHVIIPCEFAPTPLMRKSLSLPGKASSPQSPKHWQPIEMQEADSVYKKCPSEAEIIFNEVVYQQDVKARVTEWLQTTDESDPDEYDGIQVNFSNHDCATNGFEIDSGEESDIEMTYL